MNSKLAGMIFTVVLGTSIGASFYLGYCKQTGRITSADLHDGSSEFLRPKKRVGGSSEADKKEN